MTLKQALKKQTSKHFAKTKLFKELKEEGFFEEYDYSDFSFKKRAKKMTLKNLLKTKKEQDINDHSYAFRKPTFLERPSRVRKQLFNDLKYSIEKDGSKNKVFFTRTFVDPKNPTVSFLDIYFLSKKYKDVFYNAEIITTGLDLVEGLNTRYYDHFTKKREYERLKALETTGEKVFEESDHSLFNRAYYESDDCWNEEVPNFTVNKTSYKIDKSYRYGIGLQVVLNTGVPYLNASDEHIESVIQTFLDNGEVDLEIETEEHSYLLDAIKSVCTMKMVDDLRERKKELLEDVLTQKYKEGFFNDEEYELLSIKTEHRHKKIYRSFSKEDRKELDRILAVEKKFRELDEAVKIENAESVCCLINSHAYNPLKLEGFLTTFFITHNKEFKEQNVNRLLEYLDIEYTEFNKDTVQNFYDIYKDVSYEETKKTFMDMEEKNPTPYQVSMVNSVPLKI